MLIPLLAFSFISYAQPTSASASVSASAPCEHVVREGQTYDVCRFPNDGSLNVKTYWRDTNGNPYGTLLRFSQKVPNLIYAGNGSASQSDLTPAGLFISDSKALVPAVKNDDKDGLGNIFILPNGVFWVDDKGRAFVATTEDYVASQAKPVSANQSGPMLVIHGEISKRLDPKGTSLKTRNSVCVGDDLILPSRIKHSIFTPLRRS